MALVSIAKAALEIGVSRGTLYALARQKKIPHVRIGDRVLVDVAKVIAALEVAAE
jgi:excisionase family DNA binding protein